VFYLVKIVGVRDTASRRPVLTLETWDAAQFLTEMSGSSMGKKFGHQLVTLQTTFSFLLVRHQMM
jgi:hypothetical protein